MRAFQIELLDDNDKELLCSFVKEIDQDFTPPISQNYDIVKFVDKATTLGNVFVVKDNCKIEAALVCYSNDIVNRKGYISFVGVSKKLRNQGLAKILINKALEIMNKNQMVKVGIHTNNPTASALYVKCGFKIIQSDSHNIYNRQYLELAL